MLFLLKRYRLFWWTRHCLQNGDLWKIHALGNGLHRAAECVGALDNFAWFKVTASLSQVWLHPKNIKFCEMLLAWQTHKNSWKVPQASWDCSIWRCMVSSIVCTFLGVFAWAWVQTFSSRHWAKVIVPRFCKMLSWKGINTCNAIPWHIPRANCMLGVRCNSGAKIKHNKKYTTKPYIYI